ncbi:hypothetical protein A3G67_03920 [Candidatus Roizmanbacteria bacterium RIFCSPLOWO2_12_FULL_40_12]|uniref:Uncharacterized protein n=1 Tax=Candidatus Roizmanbacteria bacterium RIFCSPLOWO2_01_FULL_40_42 TaxID=1802066 RepID=A0A1F7J5U7_9BACT|nr:MAG: hypothetical protein A2779_03555 [Candidatus Roizmanbacteria bacterium RIFCSPHIGHO2_01_FULL_40_98]OGK28411.1 MAG: hypothetical protein A3C31_00920 [Candidatus Roizmanbacteria bacterium RIFCSPHIGHO2_02_FULL_40_53]OGK30647.1 MAG: hypothetical protein A2W49_03605 [Candidatus Roizmanbacteria bacterium RIFCSPHIGHO2_12_41_18]OGK35975.1 MAG: hypothetical protein A3E69_03290 [Candidatus Roizmanbacteria bacterium RIFCSPHIGHO2_12_FULL_40_130]OGK50967.1 MAG: hypothetical protein A3B50_01690 [Candi
MSNETWKRIRQIQEDEEKRKAQEREWARIHADVRRFEDSVRRSKEQREREVMEEKAKIARRSIELLTKVLKEVKQGSPEIQTARVSRLTITPVGSGTNFALEWGNKLELTPEEERFMRKYYYKRAFSTVEVPPEIVSFDGRTIEFTTSPTYTPRNTLHDDVGSIRNGAYSLSFREFHEDPDLVLPLIARQLEKGPRRSVLKKGENYWCKRTPRTNVERVFEYGEGPGRG